MPLALNNFRRRLDDEVKIRILSTTPCNGLVPSGSRHVPTPLLRCELPIDAARDNLVSVQLFQFSHSLALSCLPSALSGVPVRATTCATRTVGHEALAQGCER